MQQIAEWLEKLGMSEYAQRFAENDIDFRSCPISPIKTSRTSVLRSGIGETAARP